MSEDMDFLGAVLVLLKDHYDCSTSSNGIDVGCEFINDLLLEYKHVYGRVFDPATNASTTTTIDGGF